MNLLGKGGYVLLPVEQKCSSPLSVLLVCLRSDTSVIDFNMLWYFSFSA